jgi:hypothetical protein
MKRMMYNVPSSRGASWTRHLVAVAKREDGAVAIIAAFTFPVLLGFAGLALEYGHILGVRAESQRTADLASHAGAVAYARTGDVDMMTDAAKGVARLNGFPEGEIVVELDTSMSGGSGAAVRATITTPKPLYLPRLVGGDTSVNVVTSAVAGTQGGDPACVQALDLNGSGITMSGGTSLQTPDCGVASNAEVEAPCGTEIIAPSLSYNAGGDPRPQWCDTIVGPDGEATDITREPTTDPLAGMEALQAAAAQTADTAALSAPGGPIGSDLPTAPYENDINFGEDPSQTIAQAAKVGCKASKSGSTWRLDCKGRSRVKIRDITLADGLELDFGHETPQPTVYNIYGDIHNTSKSMTFRSGTYCVTGDIRNDYGDMTFESGTFIVNGSIRNDNGDMTFGVATYYETGTVICDEWDTEFAAGTFNVAGGIITGGGSVTEFGAGTDEIGRSTDACEWDGVRYSICNTSKLSFDGPSEFVLPGGVRNTGGSHLTLGKGNANSFQLGPSSGGDAIAIGGGSTTIMGDADNGGLFEVAGRIDGGGGGSCLVIPAADVHEIRGSLLASGAVRFGAGLYVVDGHMHIGGSGGGSAWCGGETISVKAIDTTFLISARGPQPSGGECSGQAFCLSAGYSNVRFTAPTSGPFTDIAVIGPLDSNNDAGAKFTAGASGGEVSGAFYFPNGRITLSGGASASGGSGGCLQLIGAEIDMSGGTSVASECEGVPQSGSGGGKVMLLR